MLKHAKIRFNYFQLNVLLRYTLNFWYGTIHLNHYIQIEHLTQTNKNK